MGIGGVAFDAQGNLWVTNSSAANLLSVKKTDGTWRSFSLSPVASAIDLGGITIDKSGQKWMLVRDHGLIVFSDMGTIDNTADDKVRRLSGATGNGSLPGATIMSLAVDQNGELWIGTNEGVAVIRNPENVFTGGNFDAYRPIIDQDGYGAYLLDSEAVTAIAVDGANRKWFGTDRAGVFLMSADGLEKIYHFTEDNSPLLSNSITSLTIDGNGEVFFGTSRGIIGYRAEATPPPPVFTDVVVFPNPVRPEYDGIIAVRGLGERC
jgi:ligand-binding sensor domain-containing protein